MQDLPALLIRMLAASSLLLSCSSVHADELFLRSDCNSDGEINVADPITTLGSLFAGGPSLPCADACDANDDGVIDIGDPIYTVGYLFAAGPPPPPPLQSCGTDPTTDNLSCTNSSSCEPISVQFLTNVAVANESQGLVIVSIESSQPASDLITVTLSVASGGRDHAVLGEDFTLTSMQVDLLPGDSLAEFHVVLIDDLLSEGNEWATIIIESATNAEIGTTSEFFLIVQDDEPELEVGFSSPATEATESSGSVPLALMLNYASDTTITALLSVVSAESSAQSGTDYLAPSPIEVVFSPGQTMAEAVLEILNDDLFEFEEIVAFRIDPSPEYQVSPIDENLLTILDDDAPPSASIFPTDLDLLESANPVGLTVSLNTISGVDTWVPFVVSGSASTSDYFMPTASPLLIPAGELTTVLVVVPVEDFLIESNEELVITLLESPGSTIDSATCTITIIDILVPTADISPTAADIVETGAPLILSVGLNFASPLDTVIPFTTSGTADGSDFFLSPSSTLTIPAGSMTGNIVLTPVDDGIPEPNETVVIMLGSSPTVNIGAGIATITLEGPPSPPIGLAYSDNDAFLPIGQPMTPLTPSFAAGSADSFSVNPALPPGISLDPVTGVISGAATAEQGPQGYTITATNSLGSTNVTIQIRVGLVFTLSGDSQTVNFNPANGLAAPFSVRANLRETPSGIGAPGFSGVAGWSFGMAFDDTIVTVINAVRGADAATANNGNPPAFETINLVTGGVTIGVVVDLFGVQTLLASSTQELLIVNCEAVPAFLQANPAGLTVEFPFSDNLGSPAVESVIVVGGGSVLPKFVSATVDFQP